jgi:hypothetical protein
MDKRLAKILITFTTLLITATSWAAHPLITDDTGTQGKGKFQLELNGQCDWEKEEVNGVSVKTTGEQTNATLSYGIAENVDLVLNMPYLWSRAKENDVKVYDENGIGDVVMEAKMRFLEKGGFSLALKPGIIFPTGDDEKGLGAGQIGGHIFLIASQELGSWAFHANFGYIRNENDADEHKDIWHASLASTFKLIEDLTLVANIGVERNPDDTVKDDPAFFIGGIIYSLTENLDVDFGMKCGLTKPEIDISALAGVIFRF